MYSFNTLTLLVGSSPSSDL